MGCVAVDELKPILLMLLCQLASGGVNIFYKFAVADGMKIRILVVYRLIFATVFIAPIALVFERKSRPKFTWTIAFQAITCALLGQALASNLYAESLVLTSATYAAAMANLIPALTLLMSVVFRLEKFDIRRSTGKSKVLGTGLGIAGAMILTLYKGIKIDFLSTNVNLLSHYESTTRVTVHHNLVWGTALALCSCISYAAWLILQAKLIEKYPVFSSTALTCFNGAVIAGVYCLCRERDFTDWKLGWNIRLLSAAFTGIVGSGIVIAITAWGTWVRGPLYVSSFSPLALIFVALLGSLILDEKLHLGSVIGSVIIVLGLYLVLWGKSKEIKDSSLDIAALSDGNRRGEEKPLSPVEQVP